MSSKLLKLKIVTPERLVFEEMVKQVTLPTKAGVIPVLPDHVPLISSLSSGDIVAQNDELIPFALSGGFVEVKQNKEGGEVIVLADSAESVADIEKNIEEARARAEKLARERKNVSDLDFEHFEAELERSLNRVKIADKWRNKKYR